MVMGPTHKRIPAQAIPNAMLANFEQQKGKPWKQ
jgi:hypothetical protein